MKGVIPHVALGNVSDLIMGQAPSSKDCNFEGKGVPFVKVGEFGVTRPIIREWTTNPLRMAQLTDVLLCVVGATCGKINLGEDCAIGRSVAAIRPNPAKLNQFYLYYFMMTLVERLRAGSLGAAQTVISKDMVLNIEIPLLSLTQQERIVRVLDEAFEGIAVAKANAEKNLQNARTIFVGHIYSVFEAMWRSYKVVSLNDLSAVITDGDHMPPPKSTLGIPFITIGNINKETREIDFADTFMVSRSYFNALSPNKKPQMGDVLYTVTGSFGIPVRLFDNREFCFQRHIGLIRPKPETDSSWLFYLLLSPQIFKQANDGATGTAQKTVSLKLLRNFKAPLVPLKLQQMAVKKLDELSNETHSLESIYQQKLAALDELKKSLLHQAFTGKL